MEYNVRITEVAVKEFVVTAKDEKECIQKTKRGYKDGIYTLDYENVGEVRLKIIK